MNIRCISTSGKKREEEKERGIGDESYADNSYGPHVTTLDLGTVVAQQHDALVV